MKLESILATLHEEGFLPEAGVSQAARPTVWYLRVLAGLGAWLATLFLVFFWALLASESFGLGCFLGLAQCLAAGLLASRTRHEMLHQVSLSLWLTGTCLMASCFEKQFHLEPLGLGVMLLLMSVPYPESQGRFLTALAGALLLLVGGEEAVPLDVWVGPLALLAGFHYLNQTPLWWRGLGPRTATFAGVAVLTMLAALCSSFWGWSKHPAGPSSTALLTLACLWLSSRVLRRLQVGAAISLVCWMGLLAVGGLTFNSPGVMGAVAVLLVARESRSRWLTAMGWIYLLTFGSAYFYNLNLDANAKSLTLMALGGLLLWLRRRLTGPA
ncbi:DUF4401 domain-containing protein [bacterium]|nr:DUF4401 domain-containing protein [bacterium]